MSGNSDDWSWFGKAMRDGAKPVWNRNRASGIDSLPRWAREMLALAWDQGFDAGERDAMEHEENDDWDRECIRNPYR